MKVVSKGRGAVVVKRLKTVSVDGDWMAVEVTVTTGRTSVDEARTVDVSAASSEYCVVRIVLVSVVVSAGLSK